MNKILVRQKNQALRYTDAAAVTEGVTRGVYRWLEELGYAALTEIQTWQRPACPWRSQIPS